MPKKRPAGELPVPPAAQADARAVEMLRAWIAGGGLHCVLNVGHWDGRPGIDEDVAWGKMLADVVRHLANARRHERGIEPGATVLRVFKALEAELGEPTTRHRGRFLKGRPRSDEASRPGGRE